MVLPAIVPRNHFWFSLTAVEAVFFGLGVAVVLRRLGRSGMTPAISRAARFAWPARGSFAG